MKKLVLLSLAVALAGSTAVAGGSGWLTDFEKAAKKAKKSEKPILLEFTKGDASKKLNKEVFFTSKFRAWSKKRVVLCVIDFDRKVNKKLTQQYAKFARDFEVETFPTVMLFDHEGKLLGKSTYKKGGVDPFLKEADELVEAASGAGKWTTDWAKAVKMAKRAKKPMLVDFNGSDW